MSRTSTANVSRHARAIRILRCLQAGPHFNARKLADHLRVSRRTVHRDLNLIRDAGIDIRFDPATEAYRLATDTSLPATRLKDEELTRLVLAAQLSLLQGFPRFASGVQEALLKLLSDASPVVQEVLSRLMQASVLRLPTQRYGDWSLHVLETLLVAIGRQRQVRLTVRSQQASQRPLITKLAPYRIAMSWQEWLVVGRSSVHRCTRAFELSDIQRIEMTTEPFSVPRGYFYSQPAGELVEAAAAVEPLGELLAPVAVAQPTLVAS